MNAAYVCMGTDAHTYTHTYTPTFLFKKSLGIGFSSLSIEISNHSLEPPVDLKFQALEAGRQVKWPP